VTGSVTLRFPNGGKVRSLVWEGNRLVDLVAGGASVSLTGETSRRVVNWSYPFDRALSSPSEQFQVLYSSTATKGIVTKAGKVLREIDRSFYWAAAYEFPVAVGALPDGREVLAHCPEGYNRLTIEGLADGEVLATAPEQAADVFHSRLSFSPDGRHLLSAGWVWHPVGVVRVFKVDEALTDPGYLAGEGVLPWRAVEGSVEAACWLTNARVAVFVDPDEEDFGNEGDGLRPGELGVWSLEDAQWASRTAIQGHLGTLHPFAGKVLSLYNHARLLDTDTGAVEHEWPELLTGRQVSSILGQDTVPAIALDSRHSRFAVGRDDIVTVIQVAS
jgi:hypothetical protein